MRRVAVGGEQDDHAREAEREQRDGHADHGEEDRMNHLLHDGTSWKRRTDGLKSEHHASGVRHAAWCFHVKNTSWPGAAADLRGISRGRREFPRAEKSAVAW